ncbi:MAG TPA: terminase family protein [Allosphingosinicella sp.]|nr:terminase family protein [Allosphingosinicella sp.]
MASSDRRRRRRAALPELPPDTDLLDFLLSLPPEAWAEAVRMLGLADVEAFDYDWRSWAHQGQQVPATDWSTCVAMGGRGFGKTWAGAQWILSLVREGGQPNRLSPAQPPRIALVGATLAEARRVMVEGPSGLLEVAGPWIREWRPSLGTLKFRDGAVATLFSGHSPELLRGPEHDYAWCDELAKWEAAQESWDMLQFGLRRGDRPRALVTTTPRPGPVLRRIMAMPGTVVIGGPSDANPHNSEAWLREKRARYAGTRLARQELDGELLPDTPGALWTVELLEKCRKSSPHRGEGRLAEGERGEGEPTPPHSSTAEPPLSNYQRVNIAPRCSGHAGGMTGSMIPAGERGQFTRIVIGVDPPAADGTCGIVACARDEAGFAHVLADHSVTARSPEGWSRAVADAASVWGRLHEDIPVQVVAEQNQGGKMVEAVLRIADPDLDVKPVTATAGKALRAEPVARLFEAGKVVLHDRFRELEAELLGMIAGGDYEGPGTSPDRADAMVWALTELMLGKERAEPRIRRL